MSEDTIKRYLYNKLKNTSVTIVLLTPDAVNHKKGYNGFRYEYNDWMYDEIKYSLDDKSIKNFIEKLNYPQTDISINIILIHLVL